MAEQDLIAPYDGLRWGTGERPVFRPAADAAPARGRFRELPDLYGDVDESPTEPQISLGHLLASLDASSDDVTVEVPGEVLDWLRIESFTP